MVFLLSLLLLVVAGSLNPNFPLKPPLYMASSNITYHAFRLKENEPIYASIMSVVKEKNITAGSILAGAGSLTSVNIRFANQPNGTILTGHFEIVSLIGMVSSLPKPPDEPYDAHLHLSLGREDGTTVSGHLIEGTIYTTAEIAIVQYNDLIFKRVLDPYYGYYELTIEPRE
jgi:predicted DNA-binding protein with PD1-like motif